MLYEIVYHFIVERMFGIENALALILCDVSMILIYVALVMLLIWVFNVASRIIKI